MDRTMDVYNNVLNMKSNATDATPLQNHIRMQNFLHNYNVINQYLRYYYGSETFPPINYQQKQAVSTYADPSTSSYPIYSTDTVVQSYNQLKPIVGNLKTPLPSEENQNHDTEKFSPKKQVETIFDSDDDLSSYICNYSSIPETLPLIDQSCLDSVFGSDCAITTNLDINRPELFDQSSKKWEPSIDSHSVSFTTYINSNAGETFPSQGNNQAKSTNGGYNSPNTPQGNVDYDLKFAQSKKQLEPTSGVYTTPSTTYYSAIYSNCSGQEKTFGQNNNQLEPSTVSHNSPSPSYSSSSTSTAPEVTFLPQGNNQLHSVNGGYNSTTSYGNVGYDLQTFAQSNNQLGPSNGNQSTPPALYSTSYSAPYSNCNAGGGTFPPQGNNQSTLVDGGYIAPTTHYGSVDYDSKTFAESKNKLQSHIGNYGPSSVSHNNFGYGVVTGPRPDFNDLGSRADSQTNKRKHDNMNDNVRYHCPKKSTPESSPLRKKMHVESDRSSNKEYFVNSYGLETLARSNQLGSNDSYDNSSVFYSSNYYDTETICQSNKPLKSSLIPESHPSTDSHIVSSATYSNNGSGWQTVTLQDNQAQPYTGYYNAPPTYYCNSSVETSPKQSFTQFIGYNNVPLPSYSTAVVAQRSNDGTEK